MLADRMRVAVIDTETTGFNPQSGARLIEYAVAMTHDGRVHEVGSSLVKAGVPIPPQATAVHGITDEDLARDGIEPRDAACALAVAFKSYDAVAFHNVEFDLPFVDDLIASCGWKRAVPALICTLGLSRLRWNPAGGNKLTEVVDRLRLPQGIAHRALGDAIMTGHVLIEMARWAEDRHGAKTVDDLASLSRQGNAMNPYARRR